MTRAHAHLAGNSQPQALILLGASTHPAKYLLLPDPSRPPSAINYHPEYNEAALDEVELLRQVYTSKDAHRQCLVLLHDNFLHRGVNGTHHVMAFEVLWTGDRVGVSPVFLATILVTVENAVEFAASAITPRIRALAEPLCSV